MNPIAFSSLGLSWLNLAFFSKNLVEPAQPG
jgi:hypothetical protein